ncbi:hypothetical protein PROSTU_00689, partial [Providencia stuartii ATCC 25827]
MKGWTTFEGGSSFTTYGAVCDDYTAGIGILYLSMVAPLFYPNLTS